MPGRDRGSSPVPEDGDDSPEELLLRWVDDHRAPTPPAPAQEPLTPHTSQPEWFESDPDEEYLPEIVAGPPVADVEPEPVDVPPTRLPDATSPEELLARWMGATGTTPVGEPDEPGEPDEQAHPQESATSAPGATPPVAGLPATRGLFGRRRSRRVEAAPTEAEATTIDHVDADHPSQRSDLDEGADEPVEPHVVTTWSSDLAADTTADTTADIAEPLPRDEAAAGPWPEPAPWPDPTAGVPQGGEDRARASDAAVVDGRDDVLGRSPLGTPVPLEELTEPYAVPALADPVAQDRIPSFVEYRPSNFVGYVLGGLFTVSAAAAVVAILRAISQDTRSDAMVAAALTVVAALLWCALLSWMPRVVAISDGILEVARGSRVQRFDLQSRETVIRVGDNPRARSWSAVLTRPKGRDIVIEASQVVPAEFTRIVRHHRRIAIGSPREGDDPGEG